MVKSEAFGQTVLPDRSILKGQNLVENAKIKNSKAPFWVIFKHCGIGFSNGKNNFFRQYFKSFKHSSKSMWQSL